MGSDQTMKTGTSLSEGDKDKAGSRTFRMPEKRETC